MNRALLVGLIAIVVGALIGGFMVVGGPGYARLEKQDVKRAGDLNELNRYLECRTSDQILPQTLDEQGYCDAIHLNKDSTKDHVTGEPYIYRRHDDRSFEICAVFATDTLKNKRGRAYSELLFKRAVGCRKGKTINPQ